VKKTNREMKCSKAEHCHTNIYREEDTKRQIQRRYRKAEKARITGRQTKRKTVRESVLGHYLHLRCPCGNLNHNIG
jgi:hypothetical protein